MFIYSRAFLIVSLLVLTIIVNRRLDSVAVAEYISPYAQWTNGPSSDPSYFPLGVWLQNPSTATSWKKSGINLYVGLYQGPNMNQLNSLQRSGMQVIARKNQLAPTAASMTLSGGSPLVVGWLQEDEPDNHPKTPASTIQGIYQTIKDFDATRPVMLNLSQGLGWDSQTWVGQGGRINPAIDYPAYLAGSDIMAMDIYPMSCERSKTCGDAWRPAWGVDGLHQYGDANKPAWSFIETGDVGANGNKATVDEIKMEVWSSIIHGSKGITYFVHGKSNSSNFDSIALLRPENASQLAGVTAINQEVLNLAPVINSETILGEATVSTSNPSMPIDFMVKKYDGVTYLFATGMRKFDSDGEFAFSALGNAAVDVIGEGRTIQMVDGKFSDAFFGFDTHLYRINTSVVPEPEALLLGALGSGGLMISECRRRKICSLVA